MADIAKATGKSNKTYEFHILEIAHCIQKVK